MLRTLPTCFDPGRHEHFFLLLATCRPFGFVERCFEQVTIYMRTFFEFKISNFSSLCQLVDAAAVAAFAAVCDGHLRLCFTCIC